MAAATRLQLDSNRLLMLLLLLPLLLRFDSCTGEETAAWKVQPKLSDTASNKRMESARSLAKRIAQEASGVGCGDCFFKVAGDRGSTACSAA